MLSFKVQAKQAKVFPFFGNWLPAFTPFSCINSNEESFGLDCLVGGGKVVTRTETEIGGCTPPTFTQTVFEKIIGSLLSFLPKKDLRIPFVYNLCYSSHAAQT